MNSTSSNREKIKDILHKYGSPMAFVNYYYYRLEQAGIDFPMAVLPIFVRAVRLTVTRRAASVVNRLFVGLTVSGKMLQDVHTRAYKDKIIKPTLGRNAVSKPTKDDDTSKYWWVPPLFFDLDTGESGFVDGVAIFNFPKHPKDVPLNTCTIDDVYYFNSSRFAQFMLTMPDMDRVENMDYQVEPLIVLTKENTERLKDFYRSSEHVINAKNITRSRFNANAYNCFNFPLATILVSGLGGRRSRYFCITRNGRILAMLMWTSFAGKIYVPYIRVIHRQEFDDELQPYLFHLVLYEFCKRFPRDTEIITAGSSADALAYNRFKVLCYENYKVIPSIPAGIYTRVVDNNRQLPTEIITNLNVNSYIPENYIEPYLYQMGDTFVRYGEKASPFFKLIRRLSKGLSTKGLIKQFKRFAIKHNAKIVSSFYRKRTAKTSSHYVPSTVDTEKKIVGKHFTTLVRNRDAIYGAKNN